VPFRLHWIEGLAGAWAVSHAVSVLVFLLTVVLIARVLQQRRAPTSAMSWLLAIALIPYVGVPLYLLLGGRKIARRARTKPELHEARAPHALPHIEPPLAPVRTGDARALERVLAGAGVPPPTLGNDCVLHATGQGALEAILVAIEGARASIRITTFIIAGDGAGDAVVDALSRAARRGVEVRLLVDGLFQWRASRQAIKRLRSAGGRVTFFMPVFPLPFRTRANLRNHRKIVIVDGAIGFVGGMNFADEYMGATGGPRIDDRDPPRWRDIMLELRGPSVARLDEIFRSDWAFAERESLVAAPLTDAEPGWTSFERGRVQVVPSGPDVPGDTLYDAVLTSLFEAQRRIWIATPYFIPDEALVRGLALAARRGVDVTIVVPARSNHITADLAGASSLHELQAAGARIRPWRRGMLHAKAALFDDVAVMGSANFDMRSLFLSYEVSLFLTSPADVALIERWFEATLALCEARLPRPGRARAAFESVGRLLAPLA
jgi:cardiolipin synthase A/B